MADSSAALSANFREEAYLENVGEMEFQEVAPCYTQRRTLVL